MTIGEIGSTDDTALLCHTNNPHPAGSGTSGGDWFGPDGTRVLGEHEHNSVPGFVRNRGPNVVRLKRSSSIIQPEGIYKCVIQDDILVNQTVYVRLYGMYIPNVQCSKCKVPCLVAATPPPLSSSVDGDPVVPTNSLTCGADIITRHSTFTWGASFISLTLTSVADYTSKEGISTPVSIYFTTRTSFSSLTPTLVADYTHKGGISTPVSTHFISNSYRITSAPTNPTFSS